MSLIKNAPRTVRQSRTDSCWAAVLQSWAQSDPRVTSKTEAQWIQHYGQGPAGGITPLAAIPQISNQIGAVWGGFDVNGLHRYLTGHLMGSYVFCAMTVGRYTHAILIYGVDILQNIYFMDPDGGRLRRERLDWFKQKTPFILMRKT